MALRRNKVASQKNFAMSPRADIPRSTYMLRQNRKMTWNGGRLTPILVEEMLPGDEFHGNTSIFARLATPIVPVMDDAWIETFYFFVPNRLVWDHWEEFIAGGNYTTPKTVLSAADRVAVGPYDALGLPTGTQYAGNLTVQAMPLRAIQLVWNEWFRDQNLQTSVPPQTDDGPDNDLDYSAWNYAKAHDYFTSALPWPQKPTSLLSPTANGLVIGEQGTAPTFAIDAAGGPQPLSSTNANNNVTWGALAGNTGPALWGDPNLSLNLTSAGGLVNALRQAFQIQKLLERDARGGSRYVELLQAHFGVTPQDARLQRPEYVGGGRTRINSNPVAQNAPTNAADNGSPITPMGTLAAYDTAATGSNPFNYAATEHGYMIGLARTKVNVTYQQGIRKHWLRNTRYDFYWPEFAHLGEQAVLSKEIYADGTAGDDDVFGYQERWAEYRYTPSEITGYFKSGISGTLDFWHFSQNFSSRPSLNSAFIVDPSATQFQRTQAAGALANGQQLLVDLLHEIRATRPLPTYSVPGLADHF